MTTMQRAKRSPEIGHSTERLFEDNRMKQKHFAQAGTALCTACGAVGMQKHWFVDERLSAQCALDPLVRPTICPGCDRLKEKLYEGELILESELLSDNREMVYGTIFHAAAKGFLHNPLSRIAIFEDDGNRIRVVTTTCSLAERLGKAIKRSLKGKLEIKPSPNENFVIVKWRR